MTSLNGDVFVMRNGRSTSQVSVYNYPEHLNPFYEDEQHKRLRFWQIKKSGDSGSRRNSFSLGGLKNVWAFKSFRLKKKSSTLGINKTSESPPPLRRDQQQYLSEYGNHLSLPDHRTRYSTPVGNGSFPRNAPYRSSLQNVAPAKDNNSTHLDFNRNNQYRSTIQVMGTKSNNNYKNNNKINTLTTPVPQPRRYVYGGSVTPQPHRNFDIGASVGLSHGSSQISMASTNPFDTDDDYEENNEDISLAGDTQIITSTPLKKQMQRKKRRAPAPPVRGASSSAVYSSDYSLDDSQQIQPLPELRIEECMDIANLTAAIESFVKTTQDDNADSVTADVVNSTAQNELSSKSCTEVTQNGIANTEPGRTLLNQKQINHTSEAIAEKPQTKQANTDDTKSVPETTNGKNRSVKSSSPEKQTEVEVGHVECIHVHMENGRTTTPTEPTAEPSQFTSFRGSETRLSTPDVITTKTSFTLTTPPVKRRGSTKKARMALPNTEGLKFTQTEELKITEDTGRKSSNSHKPVLPNKPHIAEIHKPARGITSATDKDNVKENRQMPLSPIPPVRHSTTAKLRQASKIELENEATKVVQNTKSTNNSETLTITESHKNLLEKDVTTKSMTVMAPTTSKFIDNNKEITNSTKTAERTQSPTELREEALESLYRPKPTGSYMEWKQTALAPLENNVPPEKRKSVKDIIESINRSQRLLNASAHKDLPHSGSSPSIGGGIIYGNETETPLMRRKFSEQSKIEKDLNDMEGTKLNNSNAITTSANNNDEIPSTSTAATTQVKSIQTNGDGNELAQDPQKLNNTEIFKKCVVKKEVQYDYREQSPTTSNLDWNPVPKPKRNKNFSEQ